MPGESLDGDVIVDETERNSPALDAQRQLVEQLLRRWLEQRRPLETLVMLVGSVLWIGLMLLALRGVWRLWASLVEVLVEVLV